MAATASADNPLASDCRAQFGRPSIRKGCRNCVTVRLLVRPHRETMHWQANANTPPFRHLLSKCAPTKLSEGIWRWWINNPSHLQQFFSKFLQLPAVNKKNLTWAWENCCNHLFANIGARTIAAPFYITATHLSPMILLELRWEPPHTQESPHLECQKKVEEIGQEKRAHRLWTHKLFWKSGQPAGLTRGKSFIFPVFRGETHKLFGPANPGTTSCLSQSHLDVNQSKKVYVLCAFSAAKKSPNTDFWYFFWLFFRVLLPKGPCRTKITTA